MPQYSLKSFDGCFLFIFILMWYLLWHDRQHNEKIRSSYICLLLTALCLFTMEFWAEYLEQIPGTYRWCTLISYIKYALRPAMLCEILMITERGTSKLRKFTLTIPLIVLTLTLAVSFPFDWVCFHYPETNNWGEGPLLPVTWITLLVYLALIVSSTIRLYGFKGESRLLLLGATFIVVNIVNERVLGFFPDAERTVIMVSILSYYLYHRSHAETEYRVQKEKELNQARIQAMVSQIKPHFIYNSLACIAETCHRNGLEGEEAIVTFSGYLRNCFQSLTEDGLVPFDEELQTIRSYLELEMMQSPDKLAVVYDIREHSFQVPVLSVETLVENAVKHGIRKKHGKGTVTLKTDRGERGIVISIIDDGTGFDTGNQLPDEKHLGLRNAKMRLEEQCGASMLLSSRINQGTEITIIIPGEKCK